MDTSSSEMSDTSRKKVKMRDILRFGPFSVENHSSVTSALHMQSPFPTTTQVTSFTSSVQQFGNCFLPCVVPEMAAPLSGSAKTSWILKEVKKNDCQICNKASDCTIYSVDKGTRCLSCAKKDDDAVAINVNSSEGSKKSYPVSHSTPLRQMTGSDVNNEGFSEIVEPEFACENTASNDSVENDIGLSVGSNVGYSGGVIHSSDDSLEISMVGPGKIDNFNNTLSSSKFLKCLSNPLEHSRTVIDLKETSEKEEENVTLKPRAKRNHESPDVNKAGESTVLNVNRGTTCANESRNASELESPVKRKAPKRQRKSSNISALDGNIVASEELLQFVQKCNSKNTLIVLKSIDDSELKCLVPSKTSAKSKTFVNKRNSDSKNEPKAFNGTKTEETFQSFEPSVPLSQKIEVLSSLATETLSMAAQNSNGNSNTSMHSQRKLHAEQLVTLPNKSPQVPGSPSKPNDQRQQSSFQTPKRKPKCSSEGLPNGLTDSAIELNPSKKRVKISTCKNVKESQNESVLAHAIQEAFKKNVSKRQKSEIVHDERDLQEKEKAVHKEQPAVRRLPKINSKSLRLQKQTINSPAQSSSSSSVTDSKDNMPSKQPTIVNLGESRDAKEKEDKVDFVAFNLSNLEEF